MENNRSKSRLLVYTLILLGGYAWAVIYAVINNGKPQQAHPAYSEQRVEIKSARPPPGRIQRP